MICNPCSVLCNKESQIKGYFPRVTAICYSSNLIRTCMNIYMHIY